MTSQDLYNREDIVYFGNGAYITQESLKARALSIAKDFIASNNVHGEIYTRGLTFQFGSPFDELDMEYDRDPDTNEWYTRITLYNKIEDDMTDIRSANGTDSPQNIADAIMELIQELDIPVDQRRRVDEQNRKIFFKTFFENIYNDLVQTTLDGEYGTWKDLWVGKPINDPVRPGYIIEIWGEEKDADREVAVQENTKYFSISICKVQEDGHPGEAVITELSDTNYESVKDNIRLVLKQFYELPIPDRGQASTLPENVFWFALDEEKCISLWYSPDDKEFRMKLEERAEDGSMGVHCELICDESYYTGNLSYDALCDTLREICEDAAIPSSLVSISDLADSIFKTYGLQVPSLCVDKPSLKDQIHQASSQKNNMLSDSVISVAHYAKNEEMKKTVLQSDALRNQTLDVCYRIPGYVKLSLADKNKLYGLVKKAISVSQIQEKALETER